MVFDSIARIAGQSLQNATAVRKSPLSNLKSPRLPTLDQVINEVDKALKTLAATPISKRNNPGLGKNDPKSELSAHERDEVIGMMRVNHVGEVCAQALYQGQAMASRDESKKKLFLQAASEEADHLAWTDERLKELGGRPSLLNPIWYGGAFALGFVAGQLGDNVSLSFMAETERQVEAHLDSHLKRLPNADRASRAIVEQMKLDEIEHGQTAIQQGGGPLPLPIKFAMKSMAKAMTTLAHRI